MRHLIDPADFTLEETLSLMDLADRIHDDPAAYKDVAARKRLATLFYEPSTRTRLSFEAAMLNLGGQVLGFPDAGVSSASKGETVADTFCGDLKFGRTVHSLFKSLSRLPGMKFVLISPEELRVPDYIISEILEPNNIPYVETRSMEEALPDLDVLYMTRVQQERFFNEEDYIRLKNSYVLTKEKLALAPADMPVLHPLPRVNEITLDVDDDPRAAYFDQVQNGVYMRMALIMTLLGLKDPKTGEVAFNVEG